MDIRIELEYSIPRGQNVNEENVGKADSMAVSLRRFTTSFSGTYYRSKFSYNVVFFKKKNKPSCDKEEVPVIICFLPQPFVLRCELKNELYLFHSRLKMRLQFPRRIYRNEIR